MSGNVLDAEAPLLPTSQISNGHASHVSKSRESLSAWLYNPGTAPLLVAGLIIGCSCGVVAYVYDSILNAFIDLTWNIVPTHVVLPLWKHAESWSWFSADTWVLGLYIVAICTVFGVCVGASQRFLGCPGDLPETVGSFHDKGYVPYSQVCVHNDALYASIALLKVLTPILWPMLRG